MRRRHRHRRVPAGLQFGSLIRAGAPRTAGEFEPGCARGRGGWTDDWSRRTETGDRGARGASWRVDGSVRAMRNGALSRGSPVWPRARSSPRSNSKRWRESLDCRHPPRPGSRPRFSGRFWSRQPPQISTYKQTRREVVFREDENTAHEPHRPGRHRAKTRAGGSRVGAMEVAKGDIYLPGGVELSRHTRSSCIVSLSSTAPGRRSRCSSRSA